MINLTGLLDSLNFGHVLAVYGNAVFMELAVAITKINWGQVYKISFILFLSLSMTSILFVINDYIFDYFIKRRMKTHHLRITNNGNTSSVFLLRTVEMPASLGIRFRIEDNPMIWVTYVPKKDKDEETAVEESHSVSESAAVQAEPENSLIPDLNDPMGASKKKKKPATVAETIAPVTKKVYDVGKQAGFFASILSNVSSLLPKNLKGISDVQSSLKGFQDQTNQVNVAINTKVSAMDNLTQQVSKLPMADKINNMQTPFSMPDEKQLSKLAADRIGFNQTNSVNEDSEEVDREDMLQNSQFNYEEEVWLKNIGKVDEKGGALIYAQSKVLDPGESMFIDIEIINLSESSAAVSHLYKIEVLQIPQSRLHLTAPSRFINGIVIFEKASMFKRILPQTITIGLMIVFLQIIATVTYLLF